MAVPSSGAISLKGIHQEIRTNDYTTAFFDGNPISLEDCSRGIEGTINTANDSANRPDGLTPHAMSEFYAYDHDKVAVGSYGNSSSTQMFSGDQGTSLVTVSGIDLSSAAYVGASVIGYTGHIYLRYESGTSFRNDPQVRRINYNSTERWSSFSTAGVTGITTTYRTTNSTYDHSATFSQITSGTSPAGRWYQLNGTPPSGGTGVNANALYYEGSSGAYSKDVYLRFPEVTFTANTIDFQGYGYGSNMGTLFLGIYITG